MACSFVIIHLFARTLPPVGVTLLRNRAGYSRTLAPRDPTFSKPFGNPVLDDLANGAKLFADGFGFTYQRLQHDVRLALLVTKVAAHNLLGRLKLAINTPIALLKPGRIPRQIKMNKIGAIGLEVNAFSRRVCADEDVAEVQRPGPC